MKAVESIGEIEFHQYMIRGERFKVPACSMNGRLTSTRCTNSKLVWVEIGLQMVDPKRIGIIGGQSSQNTAYGRKPPDFLLRAKRRPPKNTGATSDGQRPAKTKLLLLSKK